MTDVDNVDWVPTLDMPDEAEPEPKPHSQAHADIDDIEMDESDFFGFNATDLVGFGETDVDAEESGLVGLDDTDFDLEHSGFGDFDETDVNMEENTRRHFYGLDDAATEYLYDISVEDFDYDFYHNETIDEIYAIDVLERDFNGYESDGLDEHNIETLKTEDDPEVKHEFRMPGLSSAYLNKVASLLTCSHLWFYENVLNFEFVPDSPYSCYTNGNINNGNAN